MYSRSFLRKLKKKNRRCRLLKKFNYSLIPYFVGANFSLFNWIDKGLRCYKGFFLKSFAYFEILRLHKEARKFLNANLRWSVSVVRQDRFLQRVASFCSLQCRNRLLASAVRLVVAPYRRMGFRGFRCEIRRGEVALFLKHYSLHRRGLRTLYQAFTSLRKRGVFGMSSLVDLFVVDRLGQPGVTQANRFVVTYNLFNPFSLRRLFVEARWAPGIALPTLSKLYDAAGWAEREMWDMHGVRVVGHADLRRLLTDYGFRGFPLRKDFPSLGFLQVRFDEKTDSVTYEPTLVIQEDRDAPSTGVWGLKSVSLPKKRSRRALIYAKALMQFGKDTFSNLCWRRALKNREFLFLRRRLKSKFCRRKLPIRFPKYHYNPYRFHPRGVPVVHKPYPWHKLAPVWGQWYLSTMASLYMRRLRWFLLGTDTGM